MPVSGLEPATNLDYTGTNRPTTQLTRYKVVQSGKTVETYQYQHPIMVGNNKPKRQKRGNSNRSEEYKKATITRATLNIRRLVCANFSRKDKFITLTFNNAQPFDITDPQVCLKHFQIFIRRLRRSYPELKYIVVPEFQKRGALHYHMICNLPFITPEEFGQYWSFGYFDLKAIDGDMHLAFYLSKYLYKRFEHMKKDGNRLFYASKGLIRPITVYGELAEALVHRLAERGIPVQYSNTYESQFNGTVHCQLFSGKKP